MKKPTIYKILSALSLVVILIGYNQCVPTGSSKKSALRFAVKSSSNPGAFSSEEVRQISIGAFKDTVYPITRARCVACHGVSQTPLHAVADVTTAHDAVVDSYKVDFSNISNSRMILKLKNDKHNCWSDCSANASEMEAAIEEWKRLIDEKAPDATAPTTNVSGQITKESDAINYYLKADEYSASVMAESASLKAPMVKATTSGTTYIWVPEGNGFKDLTNINAGESYHSITPPKTGYYKILMLVQAPDANSDSIFFKVGSSTETSEWHIPLTKGFEWREVTKTTANLESSFYLTAGVPFNINLKQRDDGLRISRIAITSNPNYNPATPKVTKATIKIPISDLTGVPDSTFEIDVEEFDTYSYLLTNPKIKTSKDLFVKNVKVLVNGSFNPQHSTYTIVDKKVTATDSALSTSSMILLKDKGSDSDRLSFAFGHIGETEAPIDSNPTTPTTPTTPPVTKLSSVDGFKQTLWPVLRNNCMSCHGSIQPPLHSHADYNIAHTNVIESALVNFSNVASSRIVTKLKVDRHNCGSNCDALSSEVQSQINIWKNLSGK